MASYETGLLGEIAGTLPASVAPDVPLTFPQVFRTHARYVVGLLRRLGVNANDADDVAQEVFLAVHAGLPDFEGRSKLKTWLCSICVHKVQDYRRQAFRRRETVTADPAPTAVTETIEECSSRAEHLRLLEHIIEQLPDAQRQVFVLYEIEGLAMIEIARMLQCRVFTAYGRLRTARHEVRTRFERRTKDTTRRWP